MSEPVVCDKLNSKQILRIPHFGIHILYNPLPLGVSGTGEYDGKATPVIRLCDMA